MTPLVRLVIPTCLAVAMLAGCNTAPIPPGKTVPIQAALDAITSDMCAFQQRFAQSPQVQGVGVDAYTVELVLTVDAARQPPVAVAPDIAFMPTVTYGNTLLMAKDSRLVVTFRNTGQGSGAPCPQTQAPPPAPPASPPAPPK
ncbi:hypothetical protein [Cupriavidus pauculus]|uniref:hypothetical protein n=1 Tax=Cupriavidus pauculus TaxID=82633 RepID=UPI001EE26AD6|nr:hypothetical protein [Cupriavidus pauculus]GJG93066.1 hypothetical protein CBA19C6_01275 [Cupriavidus pauculus]